MSRPLTCIKATGPGLAGRDHEHFRREAHRPRPRGPLHELSVRDAILRCGRTQHTERLDGLRSDGRTDLTLRPHPVLPVALLVLRPPDLRSRHRGSTCALSRRALRGNYAGRGTASGRCDDRAPACGGRNVGLPAVPPPRDGRRSFPVCPRRGGLLGGGRPDRARCTPLRRAGGITHASLGVQDSDPRVQAAIGRPQNFGQAAAVRDLWARA